MFGNAFGWPHLLLILAVLLLVFGASKLPGLAKSLGQSARAFKGEMKAMKEDDEAAAQQAAINDAAQAPQATLNQVSDTTNVNGTPKSPDASA